MVYDELVKVNINTFSLAKIILDIVSMISQFAQLNYDKKCWKKTKKLINKKPPNLIRKQREKVKNGT